MVANSRALRRMVIIEKCVGCCSMLTYAMDDGRQVASIHSVRRQNAQHNEREKKIDYTKLRIIASVRCSPTIPLRHTPKTLEHVKPTNSSYHKHKHMNFWRILRSASFNFVCFLDDSRRYVVFHKNQDSRD